MAPRYIDFQPLYEELANVDPDIFRIIEETRKKLVFLANGVTPVCLYDLMTNLAYYYSMKHVLKFSQAEDINISLEDNPILKRMREQDKKFYGLK